MKRFPNKSFPEYMKQEHAKWPSCDEIHDMFKAWAESCPNLFSFQEIGRSVENRPILMAELTNREVSNSDKQVAVIAGCEHGGERNVGTVALELIKWLLTPAGEETLRKQRVLILPVVSVDTYENPDGSWANSNGENLFGIYNYDGSMPGEPEAQAMWRQLEANQPDMYISMHGTPLDFDGLGFHRNWESSGVSYSTRLERVYNHKILDRVNSAAEAAGYPIDRGEEDLEKLLPLIPGQEHHSMTGKDPYISATSPSYCYNRFHAVGIILEIGSIESGLLRCCEALQIGNECWEYECFPGYPNRIVTAAYIASITITASGKDAAERRKNRCLLWQHSKNITTILGRRTATQFFGIFSRAKEDYEKFDLFKNLGALLEYLEERGMPIDNTLEAIGENWKNTIRVWGDARNVKKQEDFPPYDSSLDSENIPMAAALRFRLDKLAKVKNVLVNDRILADDEYRVWQDSRYQYVEADIDPDCPRAVVLVNATPRPQQ